MIGNNGDVEEMWNMMKTLLKYDCHYRKFLFKDLYASSKMLFSKLFFIWGNVLPEELKLYESDLIEDISILKKIKVMQQLKKQNY